MTLKWFQLVDTAGTALGTSAASIDTPTVAILQDAVAKQLGDSYLVGRAPSDLSVCANRAALDAQDASLDLYSSIASLGESLKDPLVVRVPPPRPAGFPSFSLLANADAFTRECESLETLEVGVVHDIPLISKLMKSLGGCTVNGKIFWRWEEQQLAALLLRTCFPETCSDPGNPVASKKGIVVGSPGVGKSTLLCLLAFYVALVHTKNVLVYRRLLEFDLDNALLYLGWEGDRLVYFSVPQCSDKMAATIYKSMQANESAALWLDGFLYKYVLDGLTPFKVLSTAEYPDIKSSARQYVELFLLPCWRHPDLFALGRQVFRLVDDDMAERFYYSGGSVRYFTSSSVEATADAIAHAVQSVTDPAELVPHEYWRSPMDDNVRRFSHLFLQDTTPDTDVETRSNLRLFVAAYTPKDPSSKGRRYPDEFQALALQDGLAECSGTTRDYFAALTARRDAEEKTYWFPDDYDFPTIDGIVKLAPKAATSSSSLAMAEKCRVAYLQITTAATQSINGTHVKKMNAIFNVTLAETTEAEGPLFIVVCPDKAACKRFELMPSAQGVAAQRACTLYVGYVKDNEFLSYGNGMRWQSLPAILPVRQHKRHCNK